MAEIDPYSNLMKIDKYHSFEKWKLESLSREDVQNYISAKPEDITHEDGSHPKEGIYEQEYLRNSEAVLSKLYYYKEKKIKVIFRLYHRSEYFFNGLITEIGSNYFLFKLESGDIAFFYYGDISNSSIHPSSINPIKYFPRNNIPEWKRKIVFERCNNLCELKLKGCTKNANEIDHWIPITKGGNEDLSNLRGSCSHCNKVKFNNLFEDIPKKLKR